MDSNYSFTRQQILCFVRTFIAVSVPTVLATGFEHLTAKALLTLASAGATVAWRQVFPLTPPGL